MLFKNVGEPVKVRQPEEGGFKWMTLKKDETIELPEHVGVAYGFEKVEKQVTKSRVHNKKEVETKQFEEKLTRIKGLGSKTAKDLVKIFPTEHSLREAIKKGKEIPIRDDIEKKLKRKFK